MCERSRGKAYRDVRRSFTPSGLAACGPRGLGCTPPAKLSQFVITSCQSLVLTATNRFRQPLSQGCVEITGSLIVISVGASRRLVDNLVHNLFCVKILRG